MSRTRTRFDASYYSSIFGSQNNQQQDLYRSHGVLSPLRHDTPGEATRSLNPTLSKKQIHVGEGIEERKFTLTSKDVYAIYEAKCKDLLIPFYAA